MPVPTGFFGPGILGEELYKKEIVATEKGRSIFGPGIVDPPKEPEPEPEAPQVPAAVKSDVPEMSVEKLKNLVIGNPGFLDGAIEREFKREPAPRRGALRFFIEIETENENRDEVLKRLEDAMG